MKYIDYSLSMNKIFTICFLVVLIVVRVGKLSDLLIAVGSYALLYYIREYFQCYKGEIRFYEFVNAGFLMIVNLFCWIVYMYTIFLEVSSRIMLHI